MKDYIVVQGLFWIPILIAVVGIALMMLEDYWKKRPTSITNRVDKIVVHQLMLMGNGQVTDHNEGICYNIYHRLEEQVRGISSEYSRELDRVHHRLVKLSSSWHDFSGNKVFPVPCPRGGCPNLAFHSLPKWKGKYGADRRILAKFCADNWHNKSIK